MGWRNVGISLIIPPVEQINYKIFVKLSKVVKLAVELNTLFILLQTTEYNVFHT